MTPADKTLEQMVDESSGEVTGPRKHIVHSVSGKKLIFDRWNNRCYVCGWSRACGYPDLGTATIGLRVHLRIVHEIRDAEIVGADAARAKVSSTTRGGDTT
jgi:hypothetical protein